MEAFSIGSCRATPARNIIARGDKRISLEPKVMSVLVSLNERQGEVVERITLLDEIWNDDEAADDSLTRAISLLRKALGSLDDASYIQTVPKKGYRLKPTPSQANGISPGRRRCTRLLSCHLRISVRKIIRAILPMA